MKPTKTLANLALFLAIALPANQAHAQAGPTASQLLQLSTFGGITGTFTNLEGGKNLGITAGADLTYLPLHSFRPSVEFRGTYPIDNGHISDQKNFLIGPKVEHPIGRFIPYVDFLIGRGQIEYLNGGFLYNNFLYLSTNSTVYSTGIGLDYDLGPHWAAKADFQVQHWDTPVVPSGTIWPKATTFAVIYKFEFNPRHHKTK
jgi:hypothetical protein